MISILNVASAFNFNVHLLGLDCFFSEPLSYTVKWFLQQAIPVLLVVVYVMSYLVYCFARVCTVHRVSFWTFWANIHGATLMFLNLCYFSVASNTISIFNCKFNGVHHVLANEPSVVCNMEDPVYRELLLPAKMSLIYVIGFPFLEFILLRWNRYEILRDIEVPTEFRSNNYKSYGFLFSPYIPEKV